MRVVGLRAAVVSSLIAGAAGAAQAQSACEVIRPLLVIDRAKTEALRGAQIEADNKATVYAARSDLPGFKGCTVTVSKEASPYRNHEYQCEGDLASAEAASRYLEEVWACTRDSFSERGLDEEWMDDRYHLVSIEGQSSPYGRDVEISFGDEDYLWLWIDRTFPDSTEIAVRVYYYHLED